MQKTNTTCKLTKQCSAISGNIRSRMSLQCPMVDMARKQSMDVSL
jgi:hypothetical protein